MHERVANALSRMGVNVLSDARVVAVRSEKGRLTRVVVKREPESRQVATVSPATVTEPGQTVVIEAQVLLGSYVDIRFRRFSRH